MNETLKAVVLQLTADNVRNHEICLRGALGLFPDDSVGRGNEHAQATAITLRIGGETVKTSINEETAVFRERAAIERYFEKEKIFEGDLIVVERTEAREFDLWKASKRGFKYYL
jgi:hypothetical protein